MRINTPIIYANLATPFRTGKKVGRTRGKDMYPNMAGTGRVDLMSINFCDDQAIDAGKSFEIGCVMERYSADDDEGNRVLYQICGSVWAENNQHDIIPFIGVLDSNTVVSGVGNDNNRCQRWFALPVSGNSGLNSSVVEAVVSIESTWANSAGPVVVGVSFRASSGHTGEYGCCISARIYRKQVQVWDPYR